MLKSVFARAVVFYERLLFIFPGPERFTLYTPGHQRDTARGISPPDGILLGSYAVLAGSSGICRLLRFN